MIGFARNITLSADFCNLPSLGVTIAIEVGNNYYIASLSFRNSERYLNAAANSKATWEL
jgi:hypothetical protein